MGILELSLGEIIVAHPLTDHACLGTGMKRHGLSKGDHVYVYLHIHMHTHTHYIYIYIHIYIYCTYIYIYLSLSLSLL